MKKDIDRLEDVIKPVASILSFYHNRIDIIEKLYLSYMTGEISYECFKTVLQIEESYIKNLISDEGGYQRVKVVQIKTYGDNVCHE